mmetsp:Transcript_5933/g.9656  ORF Transcript_5933/g.9656 Transcript_5933/m.9656 type:complete len:192 (+) Transcript_5933:2-577(+)
MKLMTTDQIHSKHSDHHTLPRLELLSQHNIPQTWYKDEGGRNNQIQLHIRGRRSLAGRRLRCRLLYEDSGDEVMSTAKVNRPVLTFSHDTSLHLDQNGYCLLKCRIEELSFRHRLSGGELRKFVVEVSIYPDDDDDELDHHHVFAPLAVVTPGIVVKSKLPRRHRRLPLRSPFSMAQHPPLMATAEYSSSG